MICVKELVKNFDDVCAVNNITLNIPEGEMLGLLGTNGAGKTTLLRMIAGVLEADGGSIVVDGANITSGDVSEEIFYLPDDPYFFPNASMEEMILFISSTIFFLLSIILVPYWINCKSHISRVSIRSCCFPNPISFNKWFL